MLFYFFGNTSNSFSGLLCNMDMIILPIPWLYFVFCYFDYNFIKIGFYLKCACVNII